MYDLDAIEAINIEQIVTATDRLLLRGLPKRRPIARGTRDLTVAALRAVSQIEERTVYTRTRVSTKSYITVLSAAAATLWLAVLVLCLLV